MTVLRIVTWNIAAGRYTPDGRQGLTAVLATLRRLDADLIALQEVDRRIGRSGDVDQPAELAAALGMTCHFAPTLRGRGGGGWEALDRPGHDPGGPTYGIALLTRLAVDDLEPFPLPLGSHPYQGQEPRVALAATLGIAERRLTLAATHLDRRPERAAGQLRYLQQRLASWRAPRMLLGDLNLRPSRLARATLPGWRRAARGATHPAGLPVRQIDHVLLDTRMLRVRAAQVVAAPVSDHRAVLIELEVP